MNLLKTICFILLFSPMTMQGQSCGTMHLDVDVDYANTNNDQKCFDFVFTYTQGIGYISIDGREFFPQQQRVEAYLCFPRTNSTQTIRVDCYLENPVYGCPEVRHDGSVVTIEPRNPPPPPNPGFDPPCGGNTGIICP